MALLVQSVEALVKANKDQHDTLFDKVDCLTTSIKGSVTKPGLLTRIALSEASIYRIWWWLGGISFAIISAAAFIVRTGVT